MDTKEKIEMANQILNGMPTQQVKILANDKGLLEKRNPAIILTGDNRELLAD